jgi:hypothetical protein
MDDSMATFLNTNFLAHIQVEDNEQKPTETEKNSAEQKQQ